MNKSKELTLMALLILTGLNVHADEILTAQQAKSILTDENQILPQTKQLFVSGVFSKRSLFRMRSLILVII
ncbi:hypothetical protein PY247_18700 [Acinetobacter proteolyticus]|nr:hypothetical protein [Acinetobacter proteolyticus]WEI18262.1 hypothetical protein PY247_18700 [Acinetobacter proteolyticus]